jgi:hypothetical protein
MTVYVLIYDIDHGSREDCNIFYSPIEVFSDAKTRQARIDFITSKNPDIGCRTEDLDFTTDVTFTWESSIFGWDDEDEEDDDEDDDEEDNDEFTEGSEALTLLEELTDEVNQEEENTGIEFSDDFMNLSLGEFLDALADKFDADEKEKESLLVKEPELKPEDCYYCAMTIDNPWDGEEDASMVLVIPKDKFDGIKEPTPVDIPYGLVPVVMTESHSGVYLYRGVPDDAKEIMDRYGFVESSDFQKFCEDME